MKKLITYFLVFLTITIVVIYFSTYIYKQQGELSKFNTSFELVVKETEHGWNYEIYKDDKILVKQDIIPGATGKQYFKTKSDAKKIGLLVLTKIKNNERPNITLKELEDNIILPKFRTGN